ncbi:MAG TPA: alpha/beta fold hydrolase [Edaphobacter sp.]|uniref:YheT family hydrolase n=1 Tax=Edaphobacter sp. TaxID=1934404 RepID=UPI002BF4B141|nr:alpha/beta fold hydrolase [Edaphobacter sp.]HUZ96015.1 alpha/beta fold hydrolase [Edaphobacter sp.]
MSATTLPTDAVQTADFQPRRFLRNGHLQTIFGNYLPRVNNLPAPEAALVEVSPATDYQISSQVLCHCHWQPEEVRASRPTAIIVHGLEGSSDSQYVVGNSNKLWRAGCNIVRMNMRNCGGTEALAPTLYHSGLSGDVDAVMRFFVDLHHLQSIALIGYSMGGNLVLKLAGDLGKTPPPQLRGVIGISPVIDLAPSSDALHLWQNRIYEKKFVRAMLRRFRRKASLFPRAFDPNRAVGISSLRDFDERIIALYAGFAGAEDYYHRVAAARVIDQITVPTLILNSADDPFIRIAPDTRDKIVSNPSITFLETALGGHCAFLAQPDPSIGYDGYWAEHTLLRFILANA